MHLTGILSDTMDHMLVCFVLKHNSTPEYREAMATNFKITFWNSADKLLPLTTTQDDHYFTC